MTVDLWLPANPAPEPDEPISYDDWLKREAEKDRVAERLMGLVTDPARRTAA